MRKHIMFVVQLFFPEGISASKMLLAESRITSIAPIHRICANILCLWCSFFFLRGILLVKCRLQSLESQAWLQYTDYVQTYDVCGPAFFLLVKCRLQGLEYVM